MDACDELKQSQRREDWREALARVLRVGASIKARREGQPLTPPEEVVRQAREERDARLDGVC